MINWIKAYIFVILSLSLASFSWPLKEGKITSTFGESRSDHFHDGVDMTASDKNVHPVKKGDLILFWDKTIFPMENYPGPGNFKILDHGQQTYSIYMHLEDGGALKKTYTEEDTLGLYGNTGHSYGTHIHFSILNPVKRISFNPQRFMTKIEDTREPEIVAMLMRIGDKYVQIRDKSKIRLTKHYPLLLEVRDSAGGSERLGVYKLTVYLNDKKVFENKYDQLSYSSEGLLLAGKSFLHVFDEKGFYRVSGIKYLSGDNLLRVVASDYSENTAEKEFSFNVTLDMPSNEQ